jgi:Bifunctional DNA primase/polymerase, N-terminal
MPAIWFTTSLRTICRSELSARQFFIQDWRMRSPTGGQTIEAARELVRRGCAVTPVNPRSKKPRPKDWRNLRINERNIPEYFRVGDNIGIILGEASRGLVDVDLDCPEALKLADIFLPPTSMIHGRKSKPASHRWYRASLAPKKTLKFCDLDGATLLELRSTGGQTVVPPSIHESGEPMVWESNGDPADVALGVLELAVSKLAAATLLSRHWPPLGSRHDATLALSGLLLRSGRALEGVVQFIEAIAVTAGDEEARQRVRDVRSTSSRLSSGLSATGGKTLASIVGQDVVTRVRDWLHLEQVTCSSPIISTCGDDRDLLAAIRGVALDRETLAFDKRRKIAQLVREGLSGQGDFLRTNDNRAFFFHKEERRLYDVDQMPFRYLLTQVSGLGATESYFGFTLNVLQASAKRESRLVDVHTFAHFGSESGFLAVSDGNAGVWVRERAGDWQFRR